VKQLLASRGFYFTMMETTCFTEEKNEKDWGRFDEYKPGRMKRVKYKKLFERRVVFM
jgi:hypothetical protein